MEEVEQTIQSNGLVSKEYMTEHNKNRMYLQSLIDGKNLPPHVKNVDSAFTIQQMGKELGFETMQAFHYIIPIQGKLSLSAKATGALLRRGGVKFQTTEDCIKIYGNDTTTPSKEGEPHVDIRTTIKFIRDGMEEVTSFLWSEAAAQGLTGKENWLRMPKAMMWARCLSKGANRVAADLLLGLYVTEELYDALAKPNTKATFDEEGHISTIEE